MHLNYYFLNDYNFIIKGLPEESEKQFTCLGENTEKHIKKPFLFQ